MPLYLLQPKKVVDRNQNHRDNERGKCFWLSVLNNWHSIIIITLRCTLYIDLILPKTSSPAPFCCVAHLRNRWICLQTSDSVPRWGERVCRSHHPPLVVTTSCATNHSHLAPQKLLLLHYYCTFHGRRGWKNRFIRATARLPLPKIHAVYYDQEEDWDVDDDDAVCIDDVAGRYEFVHFISDWSFIYYSGLTYRR